jgi:hypothetical protein
LDAILADTNELQGDWTNGGRLDLILDAIQADTNELQTDDVPGLIAALNDFDPANDDVAVVTLVGTTTTNTDMRGTDNAALASVCTEGRLGELDAANLPADVDAILTDTGTTLDDHLTDIKGTGFVKDTNSLTNLSSGGTDVYEEDVTLT